eukprot:GHVH01003480.1.p1 GENE.GHVH01003480.1~~GHVH01003480.1.p1  ORF type:complete len:652 (+),score=64.60 GHVH01003480.1:399-2354(+)
MMSFSFVGMNQYSRGSRGCLIDDSQLPRPISSHGSTNRSAIRALKNPYGRKLTWSSGYPSSQQYGCMPVSLDDVQRDPTESDGTPISHRGGAKPRFERLSSVPHSGDSAGTAAAPSATKQAMSSSALLVIYTICLLCTSVINSIYFKKMTSAMPNYSAFLNQATSVIYIPIFGSLSLYLYATYGADGLGGPAVLQFPLYKFTAMGVLDGAASVLMMIGGTYTTGSSQVILSQTVIPVTLVTCYLGLNRRYHRYQYVGALIIMGGVAVTKLKANPDDSSASLNTSDKLAYNLVFMASTLPAAFSALYKELAFNDVEMNVNYMQFWVALWQFIVGFLLTPMQSLPLLGPQRVPLSEMPRSMKDGLLCLVAGRNSIIDHCGGPDQPQCDNCGVAWIPVLNYCLCNIAYNVFSLLVVKHGGATISFLVATLRLPITTICFSSVLFMGVGNTTTPTIWDLIGLIVLLGGLCLYRYGSLRRSSKMPGGMKQIHLYTTTLDADPIIMNVPKQDTKTSNQVRHDLYSRLSIVDPLLNPETLAMYTAYTPPKVPEQIGEYLPDTFLQRYQRLPSATNAIRRWDSAAGGGGPPHEAAMRNMTNDDQSVCSSRSRDLSDASGLRQSQRQRWLQQLALKYGEQVPRLDSNVGDTANRDFEGSK